MLLRRRCMHAGGIGGDGVVRSRIYTPCYRDQHQRRRRVTGKHTPYTNTLRSLRDTRATTNMNDMCETSKHTNVHNARNFTLFRVSFSRVCQVTCTRINVIMLIHTIRNTYYFCARHSCITRQSTSVNKFLV